MYWLERKEREGCEPVNYFPSLVGSQPEWIHSDCLDLEIPINGQWPLLEKLQLQQ